MDTIKKETPKREEEKKSIFLFLFLSEEATTAVTNQHSIMLY
jgi:hypothetical protein